MKLFVQCGIQYLMDWNKENTGQVKLYQGLGRWVKQYASDKRFKRYVEIGTWNGRGSTICVAAGFESRTDSPVLLSLETNYDRYSEAKHFWKDYKSIQVEHCRILSDENLPTFEVIQTVHTNIVNEWHYDDIVSFKSASYINTDSYEVAILDGGEYMTYFEYKKLLPHVMVFLLDDTCVQKCKKIVEELNENPEWRCVDFSITERNGWHVFERRSSNN